MSICSAHLHRGRVVLIDFLRNSNHFIIEVEAENEVVPVKILFLLVQGASLVLQMSQRSIISLKKIIHHINWERKFFLC